MVKPKKVYTPGSGPSASLLRSAATRTPAARRPPAKGVSPGRPKKLRLNPGTARQGNYRNRYQLEKLDQAIHAVKNRRMTVTEAALHFKVPKSTLHDRIRQRVKERLGRPTELSGEEEEIFVERLVMMGIWGFPLSSRDLRSLIKDYLDSVGKTTRNVAYKFFDKALHYFLLPVTMFFLNFL